MKKNYIAKLEKNIRKRKRPKIKKGVEEKHQISQMAG